MKHGKGCKPGHRLCHASVILDHAAGRRRSQHLTHKNSAPETKPCEIIYHGAFNTQCGTITPGHDGRWQTR
jgi:hypothetical protein